MSAPITPPLPHDLLDRFKEYPAHIADLRRALDSVLVKGLSGTPIFEQEIWALEGQLDAFVSSARAQLKLAQTSADSEAVEEAQREVVFMLDSGSVLSYDVGELRSHLDKNAGRAHERY